MPSCLRAIVPSCLRAFVLSCFRAFVLSCFSEQTQIYMERSGYLDLRGIPLNRNFVPTS